MLSRRLFALVFMVFLSVACTAQSDQAESPAQDSPGDAIQRIEEAVSPSFVIEGEPASTSTLAQRMAILEVPGVSVAFIRGDEIEWARGWGMADVGGGVPVTPDTLFQAASISKPIAAMAALALVEEGLLDLDAPVNDLLTSWQVPDSEFTASAPVTLRGLVTHTAGTTVHGFGGYAVGAEVPSTIGVLQGAGNSDAIVVDVQPGTVWRYSGGGYTVMQLMIEDVTGRDFAEVAQERVLDPLGMAASMYAQPLPEAFAGRAAVGYRDDGQPVEGRWHTYPELAAAGLWTTPSDLARWAISVQKGRASRSHPVLSAEMLDAMLTAGPLGHGLGPAIIMDGTVFGHGGANEGYRSNVHAYIDGDEGVAIMTNSDSGGVLALELLYTIAREYGWAGLEPERMVPVARTEEELTEYVGSYVADEPWRVTVRMVDGRLVGTQSWVDGENELLPDGDDHFFVRRDATGVQFLREDGVITAVDVQGFRFTREADQN